MSSKASNRSDRIAKTLKANIARRKESQQDKEKQKKDSKNVNNV
jgi:hypothetical protein